MTDPDRPNTIREAQSIWDELFPIMTGRIEDPLPFTRGVSTLVGAGTGAYIGSKLGPGGTAVGTGLGALGGAAFPEGAQAAARLLGIQKGPIVGLSPKEMMGLFTEEAAISTATLPLQYISRFVPEARRKFIRKMAGITPERAEWAEEMMNRYKVHLLPAQMAEGGTFASAFIKVNSFLPWFMANLRGREAASRKSLVEGAHNLITTIGNPVDHVLAGKVINMNARRTAASLFKSVQRNYRAAGDTAMENGLMFDPSKARAAARQAQIDFEQTKATVQPARVPRVDKQGNVVLNEKGEPVTDLVAWQHATNPIEIWLEKTSRLQPMNFNRSKKYIEDLQRAINGLMKDNPDAAMILVGLQKAMHSDLRDTANITGRLVFKGKDVPPESVNAAITKYQILLQRADNTMAETYNTFSGETAQRLGLKAHRRQFGLALDKRGRLSTDKLFQETFSSENITPKSMKELYDIVGPETFKMGVATKLNTAIVRSLGATIGRTSLLDHLANSKVIFEKGAGKTVSKELGFDMLPEAHGQGFETALRLAGHNPKHVQDFLDVMDVATEFQIHSWAAMAARRGQIGGIRSAMRAAIPGAALAGSGALIGGTPLGFGLFAGLGVHTLAGALADPKILRTWTGALKAKNTTQAVTAFTQELIARIHRVTDLTEEESEALDLLWDYTSGSRERVQMYLDNTFIGPNNQLMWKSHEMRREWLAGSFSSSLPERREKSIRKTVREADSSRLPSGDPSFDLPSLPMNRQFGGATFGGGFNPQRFSGRLEGGPVAAYPGPPPSQPRPNVEGLVPAGMGVRPQERQIGSPQVQGNIRRLRDLLGSPARR
jgi:hypothetical protein